LSDESGVDLFRRKQGDSWEKRYSQIKKRAVDIQPVRKNVAAYLAKYMSKGCETVKSKKKSNYYSPSRWWSKSSDAMALMHRWTTSYSLPGVKERHLKEQVIPFVKHCFDCYEMWQVESVNKYTKEISALIGRGNYEVCKEWCEYLIPVLVGMCEKHREENIKYQKNKQSYIFELWKKKEEKVRERRELNANEIKLRKQYFRLIKEFKMCPDEAYDAVFGVKRALNMESLINESYAMTSESRMIYDLELRRLIEVSYEEYVRRMRMLNSE
jgi:hypothetical protein